MAHTTHAEYTTPLAAALEGLASTGHATAFPTFKSLAARLRRTRKPRRDPGLRLAAAYRLMARKARQRGDLDTAKTHEACSYALRAAHHRNTHH